MKSLISLCLAGLLLSPFAQAADYTSGSLRVIQPWARATAPGAASGGSFLKIENKGAADRLVSASGSVSDEVQLHSMRMDGNVMRMEKLDKGIEIPAGGSVELKPGGLHIMLIGLKRPLKEGERFPLTLRFEKAGELGIEVETGSLGAAGPGAAGSGGMDHTKHMH